MPDRATTPDTPHEGIHSLRDAFRSAMPVAKKWAYFDHAAVAPISGPARQALDQWSCEAAEEGDTVWLDWFRRAELVRTLGAQLIGATADEIALVNNTTQGINFVAEGLDWRAGDNVVILDDEYPANVYPWMNQADRGVEVRRVETDFGRIDPDKLRAVCDRRTRVVSVSWVGYATGYRQDLHMIAQIVQDCGALFFLDAIQGLGAFEIDVNDVPIDFLAADGHKWLLSPEGAGIAYIRQERLEELRPHGVGWNSVVGSRDYATIDFTLKQNASRYEGGSANIPGLLALGASLDLMANQAANLRAASILEVTDYLCEQLAHVGAKVLTHRAIEPSGHDPRSGIVIMDPDGESPMSLRKRCAQAGVAVACRGGGVRLSPHAYNNHDEVDRFIEVLKSGLG